MSENIRAPLLVLELVKSLLELAVKIPA